jgi:hypothetical protein
VSFFSLAEFERPGEIAAEYGSITRCIYIQVQKVYVLYLFLGNRGIFLKKYFGWVVRCAREWSSRK